LSDLPSTEIHPPREALTAYARGGRNPQFAGHISACDSCAWIVAEAMEAERPGEVIDITPVRRNWFQRLVAWLSGR
jgi:hypothetical protein